MIFSSYTNAQKLLSIGILFVGLLIVTAVVCGVLWVQLISETPSTNANLIEGDTQKDPPPVLGRDQKLEILQQLSVSDSVNTQEQQYILSRLKTVSTANPEVVPNPGTALELQVN